MYVYLTKYVPGGHRTTHKSQYSPPTMGSQRSLRLSGLERQAPLPTEPAYQLHSPQKILMRNTNITCIQLSTQNTKSSSWDLKRFFMCICVYQSIYVQCMHASACKRPEEGQTWVLCKNIKFSLTTESFLLPLLQLLDKVTVYIKSRLCQSWYSGTCL